MKIFANNIEIRSSGPTVGSNAIVQKHLGAGLDIKVLGFSAAQFDLTFDSPTKARAVIAAVDWFIIEGSRTAFPFPLFSLKPDARMP
jgi:hypothetical protein